MKKLTLYILLSCLTPLTYAGGIPVIDSSNLAQQIQQVVSWGKQLQAMKDQFEQQIKQYQSMTGQRGYGNFLNDPKLRNYLPPEWKGVYDNITANQKLSQAYIVDQNKHLQAYNIATQKQIQIQGLLEEINNTQDPKAIAELQARISGEQTKIQNAMIQLQLSNQLAEIQNKLIQQTSYEESVERDLKEVGKPVKFPAPIKF